MTPATTQMQKPIQKTIPKQTIQTQNIPRAIVFDSGTLISFSMNGLTDVIRKLKGIFKGKFVITQDIKREIIDKPITIKRFELEALKMQALLDEGVLEMPSSLGLNDGEIAQKANEIMAEANKMFVARGKEIHLVDIGECSSLAVSRMLTEKSIPNILAVDERTIRMLTENQQGLKNFLQKKLHTKIQINQENFKMFQGFRYIRSTELVYVAYKKGLINLKGNQVLDALLWGMKFKGAAISGDEIEQIKRMK